jgi:hypothetical protein
LCVIVNGKNAVNVRRIKMKRMKISIIFVAVFYLLFAESVYAQDFEKKIKILIDLNESIEDVVKGNPDDIQGCKNANDPSKMNKCREEAENSAKKAFKERAVDNIIKKLREEKKVLGGNFLEELHKKEGMKDIRIRENLEGEINDCKPTKESYVFKCSGTVKISDALKQKLINITVPALGSLTVIIKPEDIRNTAKWRIDNGNWNKSGETVSELSEGSHTLEFGPVDGWITPKSKSLTIEKNQNVMTEGLYQKKQTFGSLTVTIKPSEAVQDGAKWRMYNGNWHDSEETVSELPTGPYSIEFIAINGWSTPGKKTVRIEKDKNVMTEGLYQKTDIQTGSLTVTLEPEAIRNTAKWRADGGSWRSSGEEISTLSAGSHTVGFGPVDGWITPENQPVSIEKDKKISTTGEYQKKPDVGSLTVTIKPSEAVQDGAKWRADNGNWHYTGETVSELPAGSHTVGFGAVDGWITPENQQVVIERDKKISTKGEYQKKSPEEKVSIIKEDKKSSASGTHKKTKASHETLKEKKDKDSSVKETHTKSSAKNFKEKIDRNQKRLDKLLEQEKKGVNVKNELIQVYKEIISDCDKMIASDELSSQEKEIIRTYRALKQKGLVVITTKKGN